MHALRFGVVHLVLVSYLAVTLTACGPNPAPYVSAELGPLEIGLSLNTNGEVSVVTGISSPKIRVGLGPVNLRFGIDNAVQLTRQRKYMLFVLWQDAAGQIWRDEYEIGQKFRVRFNSQEHVREIAGENDSVIVVVEKLLPPTGQSTLSVAIPTLSQQAPVLSQPTVLPATSIETMNRQQLAVAFGIPKDRIVRESPTKFHIFDYPLKPEYGQDSQGYIVKNGQRISSLADKEIMNFGPPEDPYKYYQGPINWRIPTSGEVGFCKAGIWTGGNSGGWTNTLRYAANDNGSVFIEGAPRAWITCDGNPAGTWALDEAMRAKNDPGAVGVYYWDSKSNQWINVK